MDKYIRLTERSSNGICIKETSTNDNMSIWNAIERLADLEDKIENGTLIGLPRIIHPNRMEWYVQYQYPNGVIQYYICFSKPEANAKLKELKEKRNG